NGWFFSFGLTTIFFISINAYVLGQAIKGAVLLGNDWVFILYNLTHGLLEIPAIYFFYRIGIKSFKIIISFLIINNYKLNFYDEIKEILKLIYYGYVFLFGAALVEFLI